MTAPKTRGNGRKHRTRLSQAAAAVAILLASIPAAPAAGQESRFAISAAAGWEMFAAYGSDDEYVMSENDFPRTPRHTVWTAGAALTYMASPAFVLRLEGRRGFGTSLTLTDPSDGDEVEIDSAARWAFSAGLLYRFAGRRLRPYLSAGAGLERLSAPRRTATTRLGYAAVFEPPEKLTAVLIQAGAGASAGLGPHWGVWAELRYIHAFGTPHDTDSGALLAGLAYGF